MSEASDTQTTPVELGQSGPRDLRIVWADGHESVYDVVYLRQHCRCAICVDEWTGKRLVTPGRIDDGVRPRAVKPVGRYAMHFDWSDGHSSGIYSFEHLRAICPCDACAAQRGD